MQLLNENSVIKYNFCKSEMVLSRKIMLSFIKRPIGFALAFVGFSVVINKLLEYVALPQYVTYVMSSLIAVAFTFLFNWLLQVQLSKEFRYKASSYIALCIFVMSILAILGALYFKHEIIEAKGAIETMPSFMVVLIGIGSSALVSVLYWGILYLMFTFGNWLSKSVVKSDAVL